MIRFMHIIATIHVDSYKTDVVLTMRSNEASGYNVQRYVGVEYDTIYEILKSESSNQIVGTLVNDIDTVKVGGVIHIEDFLFTFQVV
jgi:hypothetical protein